MKTAKDLANDVYMHWMGIATDLGDCDVHDVLSTCIDQGAIERPENAALRACILAEMIQIQGEVWLA